MVAALYTANRVWFQCEHICIRFGSVGNAPQLLSVPYGSWQILSRLRGTGRLLRKPYGFTQNWSKLGKGKLVSGVLVTIDGFCFRRLSVDTSGHQDTMKTPDETPWWCDRTIQRLDSSVASLWRARSVRKSATMSRSWDEACPHISISSNGSVDQRARCIASK